MTILVSAPARSSLLATIGVEFLSPGNIEPESSGSPGGVQSRRTTRRPPLPSSPLADVEIPPFFVVVFRSHLRRGHDRCADRPLATNDVDVSSRRRRRPFFAGVDRHIRLPNCPAAGRRPRRFRIACSTYPRPPLAATPNAYTYLC